MQVVGIKYDPRMCFRVFDWARRGMNKAACAGLLGITVSLYDQWDKRNVLFRQAWEEGHKEFETSSGGSGGYATYKEFVYGRLPQEAVDLWEKLEAAEGMRGIDGTRRRKAVLDEMDQSPVRVKQYIMLHALYSTNFVVGHACRKAGISRDILNGWMKQDKDFKELIEGAKEGMKDFYENCLVDLCARGDTAAILFAVRTKCKDRGYSDKIQIETNSTVNVNHKVSLDELPPEVKLQMIEIIKRKKAAELETPALADRRVG